MVHNGLLVANYATVLRRVWLVSDDEGFRRAFESRWRAEHVQALFADMSAEEMLARRATEVAITVLKVGVEALRERCFEALLSSGTVDLVVSIGAAGPRQSSTQLISIDDGDAALASALLITTERLRRLAAEHRAERAEEWAQAHELHSALGRYMLESRHSVNNVLTSIIGNAELMQLDERLTQEDLREQVDTIHDMALRLHEMMQRFSSFESELQIEDRLSQNEIAALPVSHMRSKGAARRE